VPGKAQREKSLWAVVSDSSDCRAGLSDNFRQPPRAWSRARSTLAQALQKTFATNSFGWHLFLGETLIREGTHFGVARPQNRHSRHLSSVESKGEVPGVRVPAGSLHY